MLRFGPDTGPVVVVALPLFEEANRVRGFAVSICRLLAKRGVASVLPDVPGQGESLVATQDSLLSMQREAFSATVEHFFKDARHVYSASIRTGAVIDTKAHALGRWYLSPLSGHDLLHELARTLAAAGRNEDARDLRNIHQADDATFPLEVTGNLIGATMAEELSGDRNSYTPAGIGIPSRLVRMDTDPKPADRHVPGTPLWRRAEPDNDPALAALLADDIADWIATCEG